MLNWLSELVAVDIFPLSGPAVRQQLWHLEALFVSHIFKLVQMRLLKSSLLKVNLGPDCSKTHKLANNQQNNQKTT